MVASIFSILFALLCLWIKMLRLAVVTLYLMPIPFKFIVLVVLIYCALVGLRWVITKALCLLLGAFNTILGWMLDCLIRAGASGFGLAVYIVLETIPAFSKRFHGWTVSFAKSVAFPACVSLYNGG